MNSNAVNPWIDNPPITAVYKDFWAWKITEVGAQLEESGDVTFDNMHFADCGVAGINIERAELATTAKASNIVFVGSSTGNPPA